MAKEVLSVQEQKPVGDSIFCEVKVTSKDGTTRYVYGIQYFICDPKKCIYVYPIWLKSRFKQTLENMGYSWKF